MHYLCKSKWTVLYVNVLYFTFLIPVFSPLQNLINNFFKPLSEILKSAIYCIGLLPMSTSKVMMTMMMMMEWNIAMIIN